MNWAWWDGKVSAHHYEEEHGLDSETLLAAARAEAGNGSETDNQKKDDQKKEDEESEPITRH